MYIAHYAADNMTEKFETLEEAKKWLEECWENDSGDEGFAEESINGQDYIAEVTHTGKFIEQGNKKKDGFVWNEERGCSVNQYDEEWPVSEHFDFYGEMVVQEKNHEQQEGKS